MNRLGVLTALFKHLMILRFQLNLVSTQSVQHSLQSINITRSDNLDSSDKVSLLVVNATLCQDQNTIDIGLSADCNVVSQETDDSGRDFCNVECVCNNETGSFIVHEKQCRDERNLRQGCNLVFGSWSWNNSWVWNSQNDRLLTLYYEDGFGFGGGFNVSTEEYSECGYTSLSTYNVAGGWSVFTIPSNESFISFFKLRRYWHFYWLIESLSDNKRLEFEGKFIKMDITCENSNEANGILEVTQISSCLVFKATGNITHEYNMNSSSTEVYSSTTLTPVSTTTNIPIPTTTERTEPSITTADLYRTSSVVATSPSDLVYKSSSVSESSSVVFSISHIQSTPVAESSSVVQDSPQIQSSSVIESDLVYKSSSVSKSSSVVKSSSVLESREVLESTSVLEITPVSSPMDESISGIQSTPVPKSRTVVQDSPQIQSSSVMESTPSKVMKSSPAYNSRPVLISVAQSTQGVKPTNKGNQIGLIVGIVVACSAAVVIITAVVILTATSLHKSYFKRMPIIQDDVSSVSMAMKSFDKNAPTHI